jgi:RecB family exonuclease
MNSKIPRASEILDLMPGCAIDPRFVTEEQLSVKARFGTAAHKMFSKAMQPNGEDWTDQERRLLNNPPSPLRDNALAVLRFRRDTGIRVLHSERRLTTARFTGMPDAIAQDDNGYWLIDFKTGKIQRPRHEVQLAAYGVLSLVCLQLAIKRFSVLEVSAGRYKVIDIPNHRIEAHQNAFLAAVDLWHWRETWSK